MAMDTKRVFIKILRIFFFLNLFPQASKAAHDAFETIILESILPSINSKCKSTSENYAGQSSSFTFQHSPSASFWDAEAAPLEPKLFLAEMSNTNSANPNKSWTLRFGSSGNMYSFRGPYGEALPPQYHNRGQFVDEVIQSVSVNIERNNDPTFPYFIHQAGVYPRDEEYVSESNPFYSPSIANLCREKECLFGTWGQMVYLPTYRRSDLLYFNSYRDCGNGIIEFTSVFHNAHADLVNGDFLDYFNAPWGGVRHSTLRDVLRSNTAGEMELVYPLNSWGDGGLQNLDDTGGFTTFTERVVIPQAQYNTARYQMPQNPQDGSTLRIFIAGNDQAVESVGHSDFWNLYCMVVPVEATFLDLEGCQEMCHLWIENGRTGFKFVSTLVLHWALNVNGFYFCNDGTVDADAFNRQFRQGDEIVASFANTGKPEEDNLSLTFVHGLQRSFDQQYATSRVRTGKSGTVRRDYTVYTVNTRANLNPGDTYVFQQFFATGELLEMPGIGAEWKNEVYEDLFSLGEMEGSPIHLYSNDDLEVFGAVVEGMEGYERCLQGEIICSGSSVPSFGSVPLFRIQCGSTIYLGSDRYHFTPPQASERDTLRSYACDGESNDVRPDWKLLGFFPEGSCDDLQGASYDEIFCQTSLPPTSFPSLTPTMTDIPSLVPSKVPSTFPSDSPTVQPSLDPSRVPSIHPTIVPSLHPSVEPTEAPSTIPSLFPSTIPSIKPTTMPSLMPSLEPSVLRSGIPTLIPSNLPSLYSSVNPSSNPSTFPSLVPSTSPSLSPTNLPSLTPFFAPSSVPSEFPSLKPSFYPSTHPTSIPSLTPSSLPTHSPSTSSFPTSSHSPTTSPIFPPTPQPTPRPTPPNINISNPQQRMMAQCQSYARNFMISVCRRSPNQVANFQLSMMECRMISMGRRVRSLSCTGKMGRPRRLLNGV